MAKVAEKILVDTAETALEFLKGIVCVYKPANFSASIVQKFILKNICKDLNQMKVREPRTHVRIQGDTTQPLEVRIGPSVADNTLLVGPRHLTKDFQCVYLKPISYRASGVTLYSINTVATYRKLMETNPLKTYRLVGKLGELHEDMFVDGRLMHKANYKYVNREAVDAITAIYQSLYQKEMFLASGVHIQSQEAYEKASKGLIRPGHVKTPVIYNIKCVEFNLPYFTLELTCTNEYEAYLLKIIFDYGQKLKTVATCCQIRCIRNAFFTVEDALLQKHWNLENIIANMQRCREIITKQKKRVDTNLKPVKFLSPKQKPHVMFERVDGKEYRALTLQNPEDLMEEKQDVLELRRVLEC